jgi:hypothetical protein
LIAFIRTRRGPGVDSRAFAVDCGKELFYFMEHMRIAPGERLIAAAERKAPPRMATPPMGALVEFADRPFNPGIFLKSLVAGTIAPAKLAKWAMLFAFIGWLGIDAAAQDVASLSVKHSPLVSSSGRSKVIVIGFMGGFVHRDDPHHPEVRLIQELREEYPTGTYFGLFENSNVDEAYRVVAQQLSVRQGKPRSESDTRNKTILLFGHSWGASAVVRLARKLDRTGVPVALTVQVDSVARPFSNDAIIPSNVREAANFYQVHGLIHGRSTITAADPGHTRIIGNFRRDYRTEPAACHDFSWYSRLFTKGHIEIECDPTLWSEIQLLLERYLPSDARNAEQLRALDSHDPKPAAEFGVVDRGNDFRSKLKGRDQDNGHCCD